MINGLFAFYQGAQAITPDGGLSANWVLIIVIGICTALIGVIFGFILNRINSIADDVKAIRTDFHSFTTKQAGINEKLEERTKGL